MCSAHVPRGDVSVSLNYYQAPADNSAPFNNTDPKDGMPHRNYSHVAQLTTVHDIRGRETEFTLDRDAFQVLQNVLPSRESAFKNDCSIKETYYPEMEKLLLDNVAGANLIFIFDHTVRRVGQDSARQPITRAHIDQTPRAVEKRIRRYYGESGEADTLLNRRYRLINVWRPLNAGPIESYPLSFASSRSVEDADIVPVEHRYSTGYTGETAAIRYNPQQEWYYLSGMAGHECLLLECFDSESLKPGSTIRGRAPHCAFADPRTRVGAEGRESIEVRALVFGP